MRQGKTGLVTAILANIYVSALVVYGGATPVSYDITLGFEEYARGSDLTEENCAALVSTFDENQLVVAANSGSYDSIGGFTPPFSSAGTNSLSLRTRFGYPCVFKLKEDGASVEIPTGHSYGIDFLAKFSICDCMPDRASLYSKSSESQLQSTSLRGAINGGTYKAIMYRPGFVCYVDDDIMLWRQEVEDGGVTNWWIRAGNGSGGTADYILTSAGGYPLPTGDEDWHRVTFKACLAEDSGVMFFNVFIDGKLARSVETIDFPSMTSKASIATVRFEGMGMVDNIVTYEESFVNPAEPPAVTNVTAMWQYPWNGKVDIAYEVAGYLSDWLFLQVSATDCSTGTNYMAAAYALAGDINAAIGAHHVVWDLDAQGIVFKSTNVVFSVAYGRPCQYCVIDLSGGVDAASYPVSYLTDIPSGGWSDEYKTTNLVLRLIEPGAFFMGAGGYASVVLTKPFYMGVFEVTQKQYELVTGSNPSYYRGDMRPVDRLSYNMIRGSSNGSRWPASAAVDADSFMGKFRARTELDFDLPTEAQWEYACRAGTTSAYNNGGDSEADLKLLGRYEGNNSDGKGGYSQHTTVGSYLPNAWGLYDMHGNVWEWCLDWYGWLSSGLTDPEGPSSGDYRVACGGSWSIDAGYCTSPSRNYYYPSNAYGYFGFRLVKTLSNEKDVLSPKAMASIVCSGESDPVVFDMGIGVSPIPELPVNATPEAVTNAIDGVRFADEGVKAAIGGSATEYAAFKAWAGKVKGAGSASGATAGEAAVVANTNAAAAYLLGAERLFENAPKIEFEEVSVADGEDGGLGTSRPTMTLSVTVKDGDEAVKCAAEKVKTLFKATSDLGDWDGAAKLEPEVSIEATDDPSVMRFKVTPCDGTARAFLRIQK